MTPGEFRFRFCYPKSGRLRWLSHLELLRSVERTIRRSGLPYAVTHGFSPHMKLSFGPALPVGTAGEREYADVWLTRYTDADELLDRLGRFAPPGLAPFEARYVSEKLASLTAALTVAMYRTDVLGREIAPAEVHEALEVKMASGELVVEHKGKTKVFDLARSVPKDVRVEAIDGGARVEFAVRMGSQGSLRPEALIRAALADSHTDVSVVRTTRLDLFVEDDKGQWSRPV